MRCGLIALLTLELGTEHAVVPAELLANSDVELTLAKGDDGGVLCSDILLFVRMRCKNTTVSV